MLRIGLVDLDTSHPGAFLPILRSQPGVEVTACWDGGTVYPPGYAESFARQHGIAHPCTRLAEMLEYVDVAFIQGCNWETHLDRAKPFLAAGKGLFLDKPMVGNLRDLHTLLAHTRQGADIVGGSALRHCKEVAAFRSRTDVGAVRSAFVSTGVDFFNYGTHAVEMALALTGPGARFVRHLGSSGQTDLFHVDFADGRHVMLQLVAPRYHFHASVTTATGLHVVEAALEGLYEPMLRQVVAHFRDGTPFPGTLEELLEAVKVSLACRQARQTGGKVWLDSLREADPGFDGAAFGQEYRISKLKPQQWP